MDITVVCVDTLNKQKALSVIERMVDIFPFKEALFFSNQIQSHKVRVIDIPDIKNITEYSKFILLDLPQYIKTDYVLIVQHDGYIINPDRWNDKFLQYDYIGAPWTIEQTKKHGGTIANIVGNGGFSLRSKKFLTACTDILRDKQIDSCEDIQCCIYEYKEFIKRGIKFAPISVAFQFSIEDVMPQDFTDNSPYSFIPPFGAHSYSALASPIISSSILKQISVHC